MDKNNVRKDYPTTSKKPPKLKTINRCKSVAIENYTPASLDDSLMLHEQVSRPNKSSSEINTENYNDHFYHTHESTFRRSDTINNPSNLQLRKTNSFHINKKTPDKLSLSRRTSSVRGVSLLVPNENIKVRTPSPSRRGHHSFRDTSRQIAFANKFALEGIQKHKSFIDDIIEDHTDKLQVVYPINISLENEFKRSKSKSHSIIDDNSLETYNTDILHRKHSHESNTNILDQQQQQQQLSLKRGGKYGYSLYLSPDSLEELQVHRSLQGLKKTHSSSMCVRPYRKSLNTTKKSKSFIVDTYPEYTLAPPIPSDPRIINVSELQRSPRLSSSALMEEKRASLERISSIRPYEMHNLDFNSMLVPFHQPRRKSSVLDPSKKIRKQSVSNNINQDSDSDRKRKNIACIIMTVFLCLVCASVFVVSITLTHSSGVSQVQNQTRKVYTFSRESPIHYNVRQENERLMQESMIRLRITKNFTESAVVSLGLTVEGIP